MKRRKLLIAGAEVAATSLLLKAGTIPQIFLKRKNCWSKVKEFLRARAARTYTQLDQAITDALSAVTPQDIVG